jgi:FkbM family methyltransferase
VVQALLPQGGVFLDIGAHFGYYTLLAAHSNPSPAVIVAVEPNNYNYALLQRNVHINSLSNVHVFNVALGDKTGEVTLFCADSNLGDHRVWSEGATIARPIQKVSMIAGDELLDSLGIREVHLIKLDVQGFEAHVISGLKRTFDRSPRCCIVMEFWPFGIARAGGCPRTLFEYLSQLGRRVFVIGDGVLHQVGRLDDILAHIRRRCENAESDGAYVDLVVGPEDVIRHAVCV